MELINKVLHLNKRDFEHINNLLTIDKLILKEFLRIIELDNFKAIQVNDVLTDETHKKIYNTIVNEFNVSPLTFLGIGSAFNPVENSNSAMIKTGKHLLLIDCGESTFKTIVKNNILDEVEKVDILITHLHGDHTGSLSTLLYYLYYMKGIKGNVYFPNDEIKNLLTLLGNKLDQYEYKIINEEVKILDNLYIEPIKIKPSSNMSCFGYKIRYNDRTIIYSGDSAELPKDINDFLRNNKYATLYQDISISDIEPHFYYKRLIEEIDEDVRSKVFAMHLDDSRHTFKLINPYKFNVVTNIF